MDQNFLRKLMKKGAAMTALRIFQIYSIKTVTILPIIERIHMKHFIPVKYIKKIGIWDFIYHRRQLSEFPKHFNTQFNSIQ